MSNDKIDLFLKAIASEIDITETEYDAAVSAYSKVGNWLSAPNSTTEVFGFQIYPQGSVKIGTVIKPLKGDDYDVDIVCLFSKNYLQLARESVKKIVGKRLKESETYSKIIEAENGRCWTLDFPGSPSFHMDILPATPSSEGSEAVNATKKDKTTGTYSNLPTNPKGFADWFLRTANSYQLPELRVNESKEPVPRYPQKTPLQMAVQLIKRHRDNYFLNKTDKVAPASIIITTLMAKTYLSQYSLLEILRTCPVHWAEHIQGSTGHYYLENPSMPKENFLDKWNKDDRKAPSDFFEWFGALLRDISHLSSASSFGRLSSLLGEMFGKGTVDKVSNGLPLLLSEDSRSVIPYNSRITDTYAFARCDTLDFPYVPNPDIRISISAIASKPNGEVLSSFTFSSPLLPKNVSLSFEAKITGAYNFTPDIIWQITNTGQEAGTEVRGSLITSTKGSNIREEHTAYQGTHFVQAFALHHGQYIAKSGLMMINVGSDSL